MRLVLLGVLLLMTAATARAADLQIIAGGGMTGPISALAPVFEKASGHRLVIRFAATPDLIRMATSGDPLDAAVVPREVFQDPSARARFAPEATIDVARVGFGVAIRAGAPRPGIGMPEKFKQVLLAAKSISTLPASAAGAQVLKTFDRLGIADDVRGKIKAQTSPAGVPQAVVAGEAELAVFLLNVLAVPGVEIAGPFPAELQQELVFQSAIAAGTFNAAAARAFVDFMKSPEARAVIAAQGMPPG
jgi:molybdate transport system substrate-binding protein